ncbi:MAG: undecaprenyldiphospho-muramoylpentapeptide beta-N-acetylglucosaminyltransferase [Gemmatimonadetes bacterium]|nr:undecaprenyldiphospho-muramoylpentapeptide beta-N-acetylglucosaminyltransferase [Gemmatimonadota bacterium]
MHDGPVVVFSGGGTGGHLYPALAIADAFRQLRPDASAFFVGATRGIESRILPQRGEDHVLLPVLGIDRARPLSSWRTGLALLRSLYSVGELFRRLRPEAVVVTGGYAGAPAGFVAGLMGIPLLLQEQNSVPGVSTRVLSRMASAIHIAFPEALTHLPASVQDRVQVSGNPVRPAPHHSTEVARSEFSLPRDAFVVLVTGGSQGSKALNAVVGDAVRGVAEGRLQRPDTLRLLWSTGPSHFDGVSNALTRLGTDWVTALPYIEEMPVALAAADLAVSRSGAMTTAEFLNQGLPALLVPLPSAAANHQAHNAEALATAGAARVMAEQGLTGEALWAEIMTLASQPSALKAMRHAAQTRALPGAANTIAAAVNALLSARGSAL